MLTIGQLADYVGVTVRAVRHYHQRGLLPEPDRDASGYRRYDADAVVRLIRIKTLAGAGVPLARIEDLLDAGPEEFSCAIVQIDKALTSRIRELQEQRRRIAGLTAGDRLFLPAEIADFLDQLRAIGISERTVQVERDGWILLAARYPQEAGRAAGFKLSALDDPEFRRIYTAFDEAYDWDPADPRLEELADAMLALIGRHPRDPAQAAAEDQADPVTLSLMTTQPGSMPPAWERLDELCRERGQAVGFG
jgi:DNA-binding transcriptional MerR regulator